METTIQETSLATLSTETVAQLCEIKSAIWHELVPSDPPMTQEAAMSELWSAPAQTTELLVTAEMAGKVIGLGMSHRPTGSVNSNLLTVTVDVHPDHRRCGFGRRILATLAAAGGEAGCDSVLGWSPRTQATTKFWEVAGLPEVLRSSRSRVPIAAVDTDLMATWSAASTARRTGYRMLSFVGPCPDEYMSIYTRAQNGMQDAPSDGLDQTYEPLDDLGVRSYEERLANRGGTGHVILAVDPTGEPAGITEVVIFGHTPAVVFQQATVTLPEHRRQGLGRWLKAEMYHHIVDHVPGAELIETGNADSNRPMLTVNEQMGFAPFLSYTIRQGDLDCVVQRLNAGG